MITRREELIFLGKNNPKLFWKGLQPQKKQTVNNITATQWFDYAKQPYEQVSEIDPPPLVNTVANLFTIQERWELRNWVLEKQKTCLSFELSF